MSMAEQLFPTDPAVIGSIWSVRGNRAPPSPTASPPEKTS